MFANPGISINSYKKIRFQEYFKPSAVHYGITIMRNFAEDVPSFGQKLNGGVGMASTSQSLAIMRTGIFHERDKENSTDGIDFDGIGPAVMSCL